MHYANGKKMLFMPSILNVWYDFSRVPNDDSCMLYEKILPFTISQWKCAPIWCRFVCLCVPVSLSNRWRQHLLYFVLYTRRTTSSKRIYTVTLRKICFDVWEHTLGVVFGALSKVMYAEIDSTIHSKTLQCAWTCFGLDDGMNSSLISESNCWPVTSFWFCGHFHLWALYK